MCTHIHIERHYREMCVQVGMCSCAGHWGALYPHTNRDRTLLGCEQRVVCVDVAWWNFKGKIHFSAASGARGMDTCGGRSVPLPGMGRPG